MEKNIINILSMVAVIFLVNACTKEAPETIMVRPEITIGQEPVNNGVIHASNKNDEDIVFFRLIPEESHVKWAAKKTTNYELSGIATIEKGDLIKKNGKFRNGQFTIDMTSINEDEDDNEFLEIIRGEEFFNVSSHPKLNIELKSIEKLANSDEYSVKANLTFLDKTKEIIIEAKISELGSPLTLEANFNINCNQWNTEYKKNIQKTESSTIKDDFQFSIKATMTEKA